MMMDSTRRTRDLLAKHGLRCTKQRIALYEALRESRCHPTADDLYRMVGQGSSSSSSSSSRLSLATVYNTLEALCAAGLCRRISTNGSDRYDADLSDHLHVRLRDDPERLEDVPQDLGRRLLDGLRNDVVKQIEDRMGVRIEEIEVQLVGSPAAGAGLPPARE